MNITIIGGSGFVGSRLIAFFKKFSDLELLNIDKMQSDIYPEITVIANVMDIDALNKHLMGTDVVVLLAAEHHDNVSPVSLYYDVNVVGMRNTLLAMQSNGIKRLVFTSSVAIYGLNKQNPSETHPADPFNDYGRSKWQAECLLQEWHQMHPDWNINIIRPTVIFGEKNRGNVYNLLRQIASGKFVMIGNGHNKKSMAYVGNVVAFISFLIHKEYKGYNVFNYVDTPDLSMNDLVYYVVEALNKHVLKVHFPYWLGLFAGYSFDLLGKILNRKLIVSSVRVKKFCAVTQFDASKAQHSGFQPAYSLKGGLVRTLQFEFAPTKHEKSDPNLIVTSNK
ncbi:MAG: NAD-dependent epimerase/dehydratase family protein [Bacteroides sp.]|jgi:nucleoside-diphosphate-sugar epimerase|nr:NAD-dependent epimerase/dehydratase family protein [Bacteroides sp.]MCI1684055.1 NAD-dependent epimerase/dehydratase family protein [Bacteroides sp.]